jgi:tetraprenyl-beta-curcumene synthase
VPEKDFPHAGVALSLRAFCALALANARYWPGVAPTVRRELARWEGCAGSIPDAHLRTLALASLREKRLNVQTAAVLAVLAPRAHRREVARAIVAMQVICDYLDTRTESPLADPLTESEELFCAFVDAVAPDAPRRAHRHTGEAPDGRYLDLLAGAVRDSLARLPSRRAVAKSIERVARRNAQAQVRFHAASSLGDARLKQWVIGEAASSALGWREFLSGAAGSVLCVHALIAAAAQRRTTEELAQRIARAYLPVCAAAVLADSVVDYEADLAANGPGFVRFYGDADAIRRAFLSTARQALTGLRELPASGWHAMFFVGAIAYYTSEPGARGDFARPLVGELQRPLQPMIGPALTTMRIWRLAMHPRPRPSKPWPTRSRPSRA